MSLASGSAATRASSAATFLASATGISAGESPSISFASLTPSLITPSLADPSDVNVTLVSSYTTTLSTSHTKLRTVIVTSYTTLLPDDSTARASSTHVTTLRTLDESEAWRARTIAAGFAAGVEFLVICLILVIWIYRRRRGLHKPIVFPPPTNIATVSLRNARKGRTKGGGGGKGKRGLDEEDDESEYSDSAVGASAGAAGVALRVTARATPTTMAIRPTASANPFANIGSSPIVSGPTPHRGPFSIPTSIMAVNDPSSILHEGAIPLRPVLRPLRTNNIPLLVPGQEIMSIRSTYSPAYPPGSGMATTSPTSATNPFSDSDIAIPLRNISTTRGATPGAVVAPIDMYARYSCYDPALLPIATPVVPVIPSLHSSLTSSSASAAMPVGSGSHVQQRQQKKFYLSESSSDSPTSPLNPTSPSSTHPTPQQQQQHKRFFIDESSSSSGTTSSSSGVSHPAIHSPSSSHRGPSPLLTSLPSSSDVDQNQPEAPSSTSSSFLIGHRSGSERDYNSQITSSSRLTPGIAGIGRGLAALDPFVVRQQRLSEMRIPVPPTMRAPVLPPPIPIARNPFLDQAFVVQQPGLQYRSSQVLSSTAYYHPTAEVGRNPFEPLHRPIRHTYHGHVLSPPPLQPSHILTPLHGLPPPPTTHGTRSRNSMETYASTDEYPRDPFYEEYNPLADRRPWNWELTHTDERLAGGATSGEEADSVYPPETESGATDSVRESKGSGSVRISLCSGEEG